MKELRNKIQRIIKEQIQKELIKNNFLNEIPNLDEEKMKQYFNLNYKESINEMARINVKEFYGYFPYNKFDIRIWSNDHNPPHFHAIGDGWDIVVSIENGEIIKIKQHGKNTKFLKYVEEVVKEWMDSNCVINPKLTNRENAEMQWLQNNSHLLVNKN